MAIDSDLKHHQDTWHLFMKGATYSGGFGAAVLLALLFFVA
ncbi:MAG: aa3-type cytochrome c oxidase subunit IV [Alphaproteobacteria bacterium]|nr:aa3-type cytochrome c oxidase subunit IV [Alphaproteobacteria bacterium]